MTDVYRGEGPAAKDIDWAKVNLPKGSAVRPRRVSLEVTHTFGQSEVRLNIDADEEELRRASEDIAAEMRRKTLLESAVAMSDRRR